MDREEWAPTEEVLAAANRYVQGACDVREVSSELQKLLTDAFIEGVWWCAKSLVEKTNGSVG